MASIAAFSFAIVDSTAITDIVLLAIFFRRVDANFTFIEEFAQLIPMTGMTKAEDIATDGVATDGVATDGVATDGVATDGVTTDGVATDGVTTDGAPSMTGKKAGVVAKSKEKVNIANGWLYFCTFHCIIPEEALCCMSLKMDNETKFVVKTINYTCQRPEPSLV